MKNMVWMRLLFIFVGIVEFVIGALFIFLPAWVFSLAAIASTDHSEYIQFPAFLIMVFGLMMFNIAVDPVKNRNLIFYCILFKIVFCTVALYNWFFAGVSWLWPVFAGFDLVYLAGFILALRALPSKTAS